MKPLTIFRLYKKQPETKLGFCLILIMSAIAMANFMSEPRAHAILISDFLCKPDSAHWFGCTNLGEDLLKSIAFSALGSISTVLKTASLVLLVSLSISSLMVMSKRSVQILFLKLIDVFLAIPSFLLILALAATLGGVGSGLTFTLLLSLWAPKTRLFFIQLEKNSTEQDLESARALGASEFRILKNYLLPRLFPLIFAQTLSLVPSIILIEASLSFLGLGKDLVLPTWGRLLFDSRDTLIEAPHFMFFTAASFVLFLVALALLQEGARKSLDPTANAGLYC